MQSLGGESVHFHHPLHHPGGNKLRLSCPCLFAADVGVSFHTRLWHVCGCSHAGAARADLVGTALL